MADVLKKYKKLKVQYALVVAELEALKKKAPAKKPAIKKAAVKKATVRSRG
jgi:hypothetical protein